MAIAYRSFASAGGDQGANIVISRPSGVVQNDILIARISAYGSGTITVTPPAGWTEITSAYITTDGGQHRLRTFWKRATSSEPTSYTFTYSTTVWRQGSISAWSGGVTSGDPINAAAAQAGSSGTTITAPSITTTVAGCRLLFLGTNVSNNIAATPPSGYTEHYEALNMYLASREQAAAGATGTAQAAMSSGSDNWTGTHVALAPASTTTPVEAERSARWAIAISVQTERAAVWHVAAAVQTERWLAWDVGAAVSREQALVWAIAQAVAGERTIAWTLAASAQAERAVAWAVQAAVSADRLVRWGISSAAPQVARPSSDVTNGTWLRSDTGANVDLYTAINEATRDDAVYIRSNNNTNDAAEVGLASLIDPQASTGHVVRYAYRASAAGGNSRTLQVQLYQGGTQIAAGTTHTLLDVTTWTAGTFTLSAAEADAITNYADLRVRFVAGGTTGGAGGNRREVWVSWAELEAPPATPAVTAERGLRWAVAASVEGERTAAWSIVTAVAAQRDLRWDVAAAVVVERGLAWQVQAAITGEAGLRWAVATAASADAVLAWQVATGVQATRTVGWAIATSLQVDRTALWALAAAVTSERRLSWNLATSVAVERAVAWSLLTSASSERRLAWEVAAAIVSADRRLAWNVATTVQADRLARWQIATAVSGARALAWTIVAAVQREGGLRWQVLVSASVDRQLDWRILAAVAADRSLTWQIAGGLTVERALRWEVLALPPGAIQIGRIVITQAAPRIVIAQTAPGIVIVQTPED